MAMIDFNFDSQLASVDWLSQILTQNGYLTEGAVESVEQEISQVNAGASATIYQLTLKYSSGSIGNRPETFLMKVAMSGETEAFEDVVVRYSAWLLFPQSKRYLILQKEPVFYEAIRRETTSLPLIECFGSAIDPVNHRTCLLLEDISDSHVQTPWPIPPSYEQCDATIIALARLHAHWWNHGNFGNEEFPLVTNQLVDETLAICRDAYNRFQNDLGDRLSDSRRDIYEKALNKLPNLLKRQLVESSQLTLAHGDAHHWNILNPKMGGEAVIFDWQTWHVNVGAYDLAYFMGVWWFPEHRSIQEKKLLRAYLDELNSKGVQYEWKDLLFDYRVSVIRHLFTPVIFSSFITPAVWWNHLDRIFCTYEDWQCGELLN
jgi:thiamine kinase-like enzyme